jgi:hypothetical protein
MMFHNGEVRTKVKDHKLNPHSSHDMTDWESSVITLFDAPRFGRMRRCKRCRAEHAYSVRGEAMRGELYRACLMGGR